MKTVFCQKLQKELPALSSAPYPGELGMQILNTISQDAWKLWLKQQTLLINENRLNVLDPKSREFLETQMKIFLFENNDEKPAGYKPL